MKRTYGMNMLNANDNKNRKMRIMAFVIVMLCFAFESKSQQDPIYSQYMFNGLILNPGYAGSHDFAEATIIYRDQWIKIEGAPKTITMAINAPIQYQQMGLGLVLNNDKIGPTNATDILFNYSYYIKTGNIGRLSFGIKGGIANHVIDYDKINIWDSDDQLIPGGTKSKWVPKFGVGIYYYTDRFYAGISIPTLLAYTGSNFDFDVAKSTFYRRHFFLTSGYVFNTWAESFKLKPFSLIKYVPNAPLQVDFNLSAIFLDKYWLGVGYRTNGAYSAMVEIGITSSIRFGYAYTHELSKLYKYTGETHEILLGIDFMKKKDKKIYSIRYF